MTGWEQAAGSRGQDGAPAAQRGRTVLTPGWRLLAPPGGRWGSSGVSTTCREGVGRCAARLVFAGRNRKSGMRRELPQTSVGHPGVAGGQASLGDLSCDGGFPARRGLFRTAVTDLCPLSDDWVHLLWQVRDVSGG